MKLSIPCSICLEESPQGSKSACDAILRDDFTYEVTCSKGHKSICIHSNPKFDVLYVYAKHAIESGFLREAVGSFSACIERYYEFFLRVKLRSEGKNFDDIDRLWKMVSSQSERQLGAYIFSYFSHYGEPPIILRQNLVEFRNKVVHKGYIPTPEEVNKFNEAVLQIVGTGIQRLQTEQLEYVLDVISKEYESIKYDSETSFLSELNVVTPSLANALNNYLCAEESKEP
ncbi:hypothetical protein QTV37_004993 [Vibrio parahaemolyticus]|nr:hypothetical protein [Vibrio parahaemolyticus]